MREAIGGAWLLGIAVAIIAIFTAYLAFSVNYAKAFKVKDGIVEKIEKYDGFFGAYNQPGSPIKEIQEFLNKIAYNNKGPCTDAVGNHTGNTKGTNTKSDYRGIDGSTISRDTKKRYTYCVERVTKHGSGGDFTTAYYKVTVFYGLSFGFVDLNSIFNLSGETKTIYYPKDTAFWA